MIKEFIQNRFDGGENSDIRAAAANQFATSINFDVHSLSSHLVPVRSYEADETYSGDSVGIRASDLAEFGQVSNQVYAVGRKNDGTGRKIYQKVVSATTWLATTAADGSAAESATGSAVPGFFFKTVNSSGQAIYWFLTSSGGFLLVGMMDFRSAVAVNFSKVALISDTNMYIKPQAIIGADGNGYISDLHNLIAVNSDGTVENPVFELTQGNYIMSVAKDGAYLALGVYNTLEGRSYVLLWDYVDAQASDRIELGEGAIMVLANLGGRLVAVIDKYVNSTFFGSATTGQGAMKIQFVGEDTPVAEVKASGVVANAIQQFKHIKNNVVYWYAKIPLADGTYREGIWSFGRQKSSQPYSLALERELPGTFEGFYGINDYLYFPHSEDGHVSRTASTDTFGTAVYETALNNSNDPYYSDQSVEKQANGVTLAVEPLTDGQSIVLKYRKN